MGAMERYGKRWVLPESIKTIKMQILKKKTTFHRFWKLQVSKNTWVLEELLVICLEVLAPLMGRLGD